MKIKKKHNSSNREKARRKVAKLHMQAANIRSDILHKATSAIVARLKEAHERPASVGIEDLNVAGMLKNHNLARAIANVGLGEFRRQIEYKAKQAGVEVVVVDQWYPSSKTCSECGVVKDELKLSERTFRCDSCGLVIDRDLNAAVNLMRISTVKTTGSNAPGDGRLQGFGPVPVGEGGIHTLLENIAR